MLQKIQVVIMLLTIPLAGVYLYAHYNDIPLSEVIIPGNPIIRIQDKPFRVEVANTPASRAQGLSGRERIDGVDGLFFVFDEADFHGIWMKDMLFPIDIIWISEDLRVIAITRNLNPNTYPRIYEPPEPVKYILEAERFFAETYGLRVGDPVELPFEGAD